MSASSHTEKHKHCKPDCVSHSSFACSLRKYSMTKSTNYRSIKKENTKSESKQNLHKKKSISYIKPFIEVKQIVNQKQMGHVNPIHVLSHQIVSGNSKQSCQKSQIQSLIMKVSLEAKKKEGHKIQPYIFNRETTQKVSPEFKENQINIEVKPHPQAFAKVKHKDFKQLQLNVDRIQKIVNLFHKKLSGIQTSNASQRDQKNNCLQLSQFTTQQRTPESELDPIMRPITVSYQVSPLLQKKQYYTDFLQPNRDQNKYHIKSSDKSMAKIEAQNLQGQLEEKQKQKLRRQKERDLIVFKQNSQKQLNYKMYQNSMVKYGSGSSKKTISKCHGHSIGF